MKRILILLICLVTIFLVACIEDNTQNVKKEFYEYYVDENQVAVHDYSTLFFEDYHIDIETLIQEESTYESIIIEKGKIYFVTLNNENLNFYEADIIGENIELTYARSGYSNGAHIYARGCKFYIEYYDGSKLVKKNKKIDSYDVATKEYINVQSGKNCDITDYLVDEDTKYIFKTVDTNEKDYIPGIDPQSFDYFEITNKENNVTKIIDEEYLKKTKYYEILKKYHYNPQKVFISKEHILLSYSICAGDGWTNPQVIFEYDFENDELIYKLLAFVQEPMHMEVIYVN